MTTKYDNQNSDNSIKSSWYEAAKGVAIVAGIAAVIIIALLILNYFQKNLLDPMRSERLENLKVELFSQPENEKLINQIRQLDLQLRKDIIRRLDFSRKGNFLLLGAVVVFLIAVKSAKTFKAKLPCPSASGDQQSRQIRQAILARWGVAVSLGGMIIAGLLFVNTSKIDFAESGFLYPSDEEIARNWASFRGPGGSGVSGYTNIPIQWDGKTGQNIMWKTPVPLAGHNSPIVWGDRVFLSGATKEKRQVFCFDGNSGKLLWQRDVKTSGGEQIELEEETGYAAPTVATDGRRFFAIFPTGDVGCFDFDGKQLWSSNLGTPDSLYGYASSLAVYQDLLLIQYDQETAEDEKSKIIALDTFSGMTVWETPRPVPNSWTSPIVVEIGNSSQVITCADPWVIAYDPSNGAELWRAECLGTDVAPSPIYAGGLVFGIHPYTSLVAIDPTGQGNVTETHVVWKATDNIPDICSPVSNGELIFTLETYGKLTCYKVSDGEKLWEQDLKTNFSASPNLVGDRLYMLSEKGVMYIAEIGGGYVERAKCLLGEKCYASPAFADGRIYIRGVENLYCIGGKK